MEDKETRKDSRKYFVLRGLIRDCFQRIILEDIDYAIRHKLDDLYLLAVVFDVNY